MKWAALVVVLGAVACGSNSTTIPAGDFSGPSGMAVAPLADRDLLFIANQGSNELRALILCHTPNQPTCPTNTDLQFLPGPIRVFVGSILTGERPLRLAGVPLSDAPVDANNPANHGAVFATTLGAVDPADHAVKPGLQLFDAAKLLAASLGKSATVAAPQLIALADPPVDVVASTVGGTTVTAFAVSQPSNGITTGTITMLSVTVAAGVAQATVTSQCTIDFVPTRLAMIPGRDDFVYVADGTMGGTAGGTGDGVVEFATASIAAAGGGACPAGRRIPASDPLDSPRRPRPLKSIAISPPSVDTTGANTLPAGQVILGVTLGDPSLCANHAVGICPATAQPVPAGTMCADQGIRNCGEGRVVILGNDPGNTSALVRAPGVPGATNLPMEPLRPPGAAREVTFMGRTSCATSTKNAGDLRCTAIRVGVPQGNATIIQRSVIGLVSTVDGVTYFLDVDNVRFFDDVRDSTGGGDPSPTFISSSVSPQPPPGVDPPVFNLAASDASNASKLNSGWVNAGVLRSTNWRAAWHAAIPGLESIGGSLSRDPTPGSPITLTLPAGKDLTPWINSPEIQLGSPSACTQPYPQCVGEFVRVKSYSANATCPDLAVVPATTDIPIIAVNPGSLVLQPVPGFDPDPACLSGNVGGTFEVHAGDTNAGGWIVLEDFDMLGRVPHGGPLFVVSGNRFDYPLTLKADPNGPFTKPQPNPHDIVLAFSLTGPEPTVAGTVLTLTLGRGGSPTQVQDVTSAGTPGYAGPVLVYSSPLRPNDEFIFTALTGSNSVLFSIQAQFFLEIFR